MSDRNTVVLVGGMASGKTTAANALECCGFSRIVTYTTRPMRKGEIPGKDYHFLEEAIFLSLKRDGFFSETSSYDTAYGTWHYGSSHESYNKEGNYVIILNPEGVLQVNRKKVYVVFIDPPDHILFRRALHRGDDEREIMRRIPEDNVKFGLMLQKIKPDLWVCGEGSTPEDLVGKIKLLTGIGITE